MMANKKEFNLFKVEFKKWQDRFGLNGWKVYFKEEKTENAFADITTDIGNMVATVRYNNEDAEFKDPEVSAKHEAIHLLIGRLEQNARYRYVTSADINETAEELVHKLEGLI